jgi:putative endonuclease
MSSKEIGKLGEKVALEYLKKKGYKILERNWQRKSLKKEEIDIIAKKGEIISFVEVKTLIENKEKENNFLPEDKVNFFKKRKLIRACQSYLLEKKFSLDLPWQIDVISVKLNLVSKKAKIKHFPNAFISEFFKI